MLGALAAHIAGLAVDDALDRAPLDATVVGLSLDSIAADQLHGRDKHRRRGLAVEDLLLGHADQEPGLAQWGEFGCGRS